MKSACLSLLVSLLFMTACGAGSGQTASPPQASAYIQNKGSDTMVNLALAWAERYQAEHPDVSLSVTGGGSGTGIAALINGTVDIANASRAMTADEIKQAEANGITPVEFVVSRDAIAVVVNPENPVQRLTLQQISDIYSGKINNWSTVGGDDRPIVRLSRETNSGTHVYFLQTVIRLGDNNNKTLFSTDTLLLPSSEGIINEVRQNPNAIGYDGLGYIPPDLMNSVIAVAHDASGPYVIPSIATVNDNSYPVARDLYMYTAGEPAGAIKDYINWILSPEAQTIVANLGFVPIK
ncbi:MAG TPA: phosphate ABC transporter substrate-binding protein [Anaerolineales bacterium]